MQHAYKNLRDCVFHNPLGLSVLPAKIRNIADVYIPYSTGIEFEASSNDNLSLSSYMNALDKVDEKIMNTNVDVFEQRFRLYSGERGLRNLYDVCQFMKECFLLNNASGLHYHIDFNDMLKHDYRTNLISYAEYGTNFNWVLVELDQWKYKGDYNSRQIARAKNSWVRIHPTHNTVEFRIGEMSFDYELIVKRILHLQSICKRIKKQILSTQ